MDRRSDGHERRSYHRYPVEAEVRYRLAEAGEPVEEGTGRMINLSNGGLFFESESTPPVGTEIELFLPWPSRAHTATPLMVCIAGKIVRGQGGHVAVEILSYDYRLDREESAESTHEQHSNWWAELSGVHFDRHRHQEREPDVQ